MLDTDNILWDGVLIDITERKQAEAALFESEHKFRAIFDQSFEFIGLMTTDGTLVKANQAALDFSGLADESDVIGKPFWETPWWDHSAEMQERSQAAIRAGCSRRICPVRSNPSAEDGSTPLYRFFLKARDG